MRRECFLSCLSLETRLASKLVGKCSPKDRAVGTNPRSLGQLRGRLHLLQHQQSLRTLRVVKSHIGALSDQVIDNINGNTSLPGDPTHRSGSVLVHRARRVASLKFGEVATRA